MAKPNTFLVGLFVLAGVVIAAGAAVWLGASKYFKPTGVYVTFFDESVNGLERDAPVKFRGVTVGRVSHIGVAPDGRLVEVELSLTPDFMVTPSITSQLQSAGITGIKYVGLDVGRPQMKGRTLAPKIAVEHPIIPSEPSDFKELVESLKDLQEKFLQVDFKGISDAIKGSMTSLNSLIDNEHWAPILANLDRTVAELAATSEKMEKLASDPVIHSTLNETNRMISEGRKLVEETRKQVQALNLPSRVDAALGYVQGVTKNAGSFIEKANQDTSEMAEQMTDFVQGVENRTERMFTDLQGAIAELQQTLENLRLLTETIRERPSSLLFSNAPEPRNSRSER